MTLDTLTISTTLTKLSRLPMHYTILTGPLVNILTSIASIMPTIAVYVNTQQLTNPLATRQGRNGEWNMNRKLIMRCEHPAHCESCLDDCRRAEIAAHEAEIKGKLLEACHAMLVVTSKGEKPRKLDEALTWRQNDELAQEMTKTAIAKATE
jgi:hypothetical protein